MIREHDLILDELKNNLSKAKNRMKKLVDKNWREVQFFVGENVFLKLQPYHFRSLASCSNEKLSPCFYRRYEIAKKVGLHIS